MRDEHGRAYAREVGGYFREGSGEVQEWIFSSVPPGKRGELPPFRVPRFARTLSRWLNLLIEGGFVPEGFGEPYPDDEAVREYPGLQSARVFAYFLHVRARKPGWGPAGRVSP